MARAGGAILRPFCLPVNWVMPARMKPSDLDLAYAAGLMDGEGTIGITELSVTPGRRKNGRPYRASPSHRIYVAITMVDFIAIEWMHSTFGGHLQHLKQRDPRHRPTFRWSTASAGAADFCELIAPYLKVKRRQAEIAARFYREHMGRQFQGGQGLPIDEVALRREKMAEIRELNHRGTAAIGGK